MRSRRVRQPGSFLMRSTYMIMNGGSAFDFLAPGYDTSFSRSNTGLQQRMAGRRRLGEFLSGKGQLRILEINCGTGDDALWLGSLGHEVIATDQSETMIREARQKAALSGENQVDFRVCRFGDLEETFRGSRFDLIFSNFAGLNCVSPEELSRLGPQFDGLLQPDGRFVAVLFGKYCWMEAFYFLSKTDIRNAFRRWGLREVPVRLGEAVFQPVYYYPVSHFVRMLGGFRLVEKYPVGLFIPPSYLEGFVQRHQGLFRLLIKLEKIMGRFRAGSELADHVYIHLKKKERK